MEAEDRRRLDDLLPGDGVIEKSLPEDHVGCKKVRLERRKEIKWEVPDYQKNDHHSHGADDRADGIFDEGRE